LLVVLAIQLLFSYGVYSILRYQAREAMEQKMLQTLPESKLALIVMQPANHHEFSFSWFADDEFSYKGHMYDVVRKKVNGGITYFYCMDDTREADLDKQLDKQVEEIAQGGRLPAKNNQNLLKNILKEYIACTAIHTELYPQPFQFSETIIQYKESFLPLTISPPPEWLA